MPLEAQAAVLILEVLESVLAAPGLTPGLSLVLHRIVAAHGVSRAAAVTVSRDSVRVADALGLSPAEADRLHAALSDAARPLAAALRSTEDAVRCLPIETDETTGAPWIVVPLRDAAGRAFAAFVVVELDGDGDLDGDGAAARVLDALRPLRPALAVLCEREMARKAAAERERRLDTFRTMYDALPDPILVTDARMRITLENRRAHTLFHAEEGDADDRRRVVAVNHHLFTAYVARPAGSDPGDLTLVEPDTGADLRFEVVASPLPEDGRADGGATLWMLRDVTALKRASNDLQLSLRKVRRAEARSRRERDRLDRILASVGAPIVVTDDRSEVILMNREAERLFERPDGAPPGSGEERGASANEARFARVVADFARGGEAEGMTRLDLTEPGTGTDFPVEIVSGRVLGDKGETAAVVSVFHDKSREVENARLATELGRLNEVLEERIADATRELAERNRELEWQRSELERAYRLKSEFLASMSHELRTPINALLGYASLMRDRIYGELTQRQEEALARMQSASEHLLDLVNDVLDLAKIEAGRMPVTVEPVDAAEVLRELGQALEPMVRRKALSFEIDAEDGLPLLQTDRTRVKQIVLNLLSNAVKFTHRGGVRVRARAVEGGVDIAVADTGIGIAKEDLETIWDDFRQVDQSSTREYGGTGLGLSIVRKLLALLGGSVRVESEPGKGSVFTVTLPLESRPLPAGEEAARVANLAPMPAPAGSNGDRAEGG